MYILKDIKFLTLFILLTVFGQSFGAWDGTIATTAPGDTTIDGKVFYKITNEQELAWFAAQVNSSTASNANPNPSINALLMDDMDMGSVLWTPIAAGKGETKFKGTFDGNGHKIVGLYTNGEELAAIHNNEYCNVAHDKSPAAPNCNGQNVGFIGTLSTGGKVKNLILEVVDIQASNSEGSILGNGKPISVGSLVGWQEDGTISGVYVSGSITTSGKGQGVGGLVGNVAKGTIENCVSEVSIYAGGNQAFVGGIAGYTKGSVNIKSSAFTGNITNDGKNGAVGGIVGNSTNANLKVTNTFYDTDDFENGLGTGKISNQKPTGVAEINTEENICKMNGGQMVNGECTKNSPWSVGSNSVSLNGSDGYKITFVANGGSFGENAKTHKIVAKGAPITGDEITEPSLVNRYFGGWATTSEAEEPESLGSADAPKTIYAVWYDSYLVTFKTDSEAEPLAEFSVVKHGTISTNDVNIPFSKVGDATTPFYFFVGWSETSGKLLEANVDPTDQDTIDLAHFDLVKNTTLYAVWTKAKLFHVTFNASLHGHNDVWFIKEDVYQGENVPRPTGVIAEAGYEVIGWCTVNEECSESDEYKFDSPLQGDLDLYAKWGLKSYTINYENMEGATNPSTNKSSVTILDESFELLPASKEGYEFKGWYYDDGTFGNKAENIVPSEFTDDKSVYAKWEPIVYVIQYLSGKMASGTVKSDTVNYGIQINLKGAQDKYSLAGCGLQTGWSETDLGEKKYDLEETYTAYSNLRLYPYWDNCSQYNVTYVLNGGTNNDGNPNTYKGPAPVELLDPSYEGYHFDGWYKESQFVNKVEEIEKISENVSYYAKWVNTITYKPDDALSGSGAHDSTEYKTKNKTYTLRKAIDKYVRSNYTLDGWSTTDGEVYDLGQVLSKDFHSDLTLYPHWKANEFEITYNLDGGTLPEDVTNPQIYTVESAFDLPIPTKDGYDFVNWTDDESGNVVTAIALNSTGAKSFTAHWNVAEYIATYDLAGGSMDGNESFTFTIESDDITLATPSRDGYSFDGWLDGVTSSVITVLSQGSIGSRTLTAQWTIENYPIVYHNVDGATFETDNPTTYTVEDEFPIVLNSPAKVGFNFLGWFVSEDAEEPVAGIAAGSTGEAHFYAKWELAPSTITVTASTEIFEYDAQEHQATCSYEGVVPVGYSIAMTPTGIVQTVGDGNVPTSCNVAFTEDATGDDATDLFSGVLEIVDGTISVKAKVVNYGGVAVITDEDGTRAEIDDGAMTKIDIPNDVPVDHVEFNRNFPLVKYATVVLPFTIDTNKVHGAKFYTVVMQKTDGKWVAGASPVKTTQLTANTPYLIFAQDANLTFDGPVTLNTSEINNTTTVNVNEGCSWTFKGTYEQIVWDKDHPDLKKVYAFSAHDVSDDIKIGKFVKFGAESWIRPMRAYLIYEALPEPGVDPAPSPAAHQYARVFKSMPSTASIEDTDMPEWIDVVIIGDDNEETTPIAQMNSRTGEIRMMDGWFDMKGRKLNAKPTVKGIYYHNGQRIIVK